MRDWTILAERLGSGAKTQRGAARFLASRHDAVIWHLRQRERRETPREWRARERERKSHPEAKRARSDKQFRKKYMAQLRRREAKLTSYDSTSLVGVLHRIDTDTERQTGAGFPGFYPRWPQSWDSIQKCRYIATGKTKGYPICTDGALVPTHPTLARKMGAEINMSGKNAKIIPCRKESHRHHESGVTHWRNGRPRSYDRAVNDNYVRSLALIVSPQRIEYVLHTTHIMVELPKPYHWDTDQHGLKVVRGKDDYHPHACDLLDGAKHLVPALDRNRERRREAERLQAVRAAELEGVYVCVSDSVKAGNCQVGTLNYARQHHLDTHMHYAAGALLKMSNGDEWAVERAIKVAAKRHHRECGAGVCHLSDHQ